MAKAYRWFKISEANSEIERLEGELAKATDAATSNSTDVADQAESLRKENDSLRSQIKELTDAKAKAEADALKVKTDFEAKEKNLAAEVEKQASAKALQITAGQGQPPISATPAVTPAQPETKKNLKGLELVRASFQSQVTSFNAAHK